MDSGLIYANARIKALENNLMTTDKMVRMVDSRSLNDAIKVLIENNYGGGVVLDNPNKFYEMLDAEAEITNKFIKSIMVEGQGMEIFFIKKDYHNAKAIVKAKYTNLENYESMLQKGGFIEIQNMINDIMADDYKNFPSYLTDALDYIDNEFVTGNRNPQLIDIAIDKAYFANSEEIAKKAAPSIKKYIKAIIDTTNISIFTRCRRANFSKKQFENSYINGGELHLDFFVELYEETVEVVSEKFRYTAYKDLVAILIEGKNSLVDYETAVDNYLLDFFKKDKFDMFSIAPMAGYYLAKQTEIKVARIILVCLKNGVDKLIIKKRLRELYA